MTRLLTIPIAVLLLAPAGADAALCEYRGPRPPEPSKAERFLQGTIETRRTLTLPSGRRYVQRVNADPASRERAFSSGLFIPLTAREAAYVGARFSLTDPRRTRRLDAYMRRHRDVFGAIAVGDDYPRMPYLRIRVTRDLARHRAAIRRRYALRFEMERVRYSKRELERIRDAIDTDALAAQDIHWVTLGTRDDRVELRVTTPRADAQEVVRGMYGPAVRVTVLGATRTYLGCTEPDEYRVEPDGRTLTLVWRGSSSIDSRSVEVVESEGEVRVGIVVEIPHGPLNADDSPHEISVTLAAPLGDRAVKSIGRGEPVPRRGPRP